ncbi:hypothetical protein ACV30B_15535 [Clostridium perfringens]|uniref:Uncharacterized protein n=1 Tax=Clostridium perfringens TaxID=1502 RepID=A0A133N1T5_CLOPF|nr:hypothetical protein [Clostridium perfringens]KXA10266.1 hypothetical protein HMPREF3222_02115 [Clostridium perfringens]
MDKKYEEVQLFCNNSKWEKVKECFNEDGFRILLEFSDLLNDYAAQINAISKTIKILKKWEKKDFFKLNETKYEIDWFGCYQKKGREEVTLPQAKKMYKEVRLKYDALYEVLLNAGEIHYKNKNALIDKYIE